MRFRILSKPSGMFPGMEYSISELTNPLLFSSVAGSISGLGETLKLEKAFEVSPEN